MNEVQILAIRAALANMMQGGYLSICTIDKILAITHGIPSREDYQLLHLLHCVSFRDMEPELLRGIPVLLQRVLQSEGIEITFNAISDRSQLRFIDVKPSKGRLSA